jgi:hypothetical protein
MRRSCRNPTAVLAQQHFVSLPSDISPGYFHYITLHYMLHSTRSGKTHSGANERLVGGRNLEKDLIAIEKDLTFNCAWCLAQCVSQPALALIPQLRLDKASSSNRSLQVRIWVETPSQKHR